MDLLKVRGIGMREWKYLVDRRGDGYKLVEVVDDDAKNRTEIEVRSCFGKGGWISGGFPFFWVSLI